MLTMNRRRSLVLMGFAGTQALWADGLACIATSPTATEGPYWVDERLNRSDIRTDPSDGSVQQGTPLTLAITVQETNGSTCTPLAGAWVDIWHCGYQGLYSDEQANNTVGKKFLRGYQVSDDTGLVNFTTVYPGWYSGRAVHIHLRVRTFNGSSQYDEFTSQLFFTESTTDTVHATAPYNTRGRRDTVNSTDMVYTGMQNPSSMILNITKTAAGYAGVITVGVNLKQVIAKPVLSTGGAVNAAGYQQGIAPGAWVSLFGANLAASTRAVATTDLVNGALPATLAGVSVAINSKGAYMQYVSPTQINVLAPPDAATGPVPVTVTNASGVSNALTANIQPTLPALFVALGYVAGLGNAAVKPGAAVSIYGTGFGPTKDTVPPGAVFQGSYPLANNVTVTIGNAPAVVTYAGVVAAGLVQLNVTVPSLADGDYPVVAQVAGLNTQSSVLVRIKN